MNGHVDTPYGPMPGCATCGVIVMHGTPHVCEHGVTPAPSIEVTATLTIDDPEFYRRILGDDRGD